MTTQSKKIKPDLQHLRKKGVWKKTASSTGGEFSGKVSGCPHALKRHSPGK
jgi:hypothetical protein